MRQQLHAKLTRAYDADAAAHSLGGMVAGSAFARFRRIRLNRGFAVLRLVPSFEGGKLPLLRPHRVPRDGAELRPLWRIRPNGTKALHREKPLPDQRLVVELGAT